MKNYEIKIEKEITKVVDLDNIYEVNTVLEILKIRLDRINKMLCNAPTLQEYDEEVRIRMALMKEINKLMAVQELNEDPQK